MVLRVVDASDYGQRLRSDRKLRVLLTGLQDEAGRGLLRRLADRNCKLIVQTPAESAEIAGLVEDLQAAGTEVSAYYGAIDYAAAAMRFTADAAIMQGSLDLVVNFVSLRAADMAEIAENGGGFEDVVEPGLAAAVHGSRVAANRMGLTWRNGLVVNVLSVDSSAGGAYGALLAGLARTALAMCTQSLAERWAEDGIRINAITPPAAEMSTHDAISDIVFGLLDGDAAHMSGCVFDPDLAHAAC